MTGTRSATAVEHPTRRATRNEPWRRDFKRLAGCLSALLSAWVACPLLLHAEQGSPKPITLAAIVDVIEAREKRTASVSLRWTESDRYSARPRMAKPAEFTFPCEMLLKGVCMRYVSQMLSHHDGDVSLIDYVSSYDGNESRMLDGQKRPHGSILDENANTDAHLYKLMPFMLYFRPFAEPFATLKRKDLKLLGGRKTIDGHECVAIEDGQLRIYLDCDRDFIPVAFEGYLKNGDRYLDGNVEYYRDVKHEGLSWVPKAFRVTCKRWGVVARGDRVQTEIGIPLKDSDFSLIFKPGTIVWDERAHQEHFVRKDGSKYPLKPPRWKYPLPEE
jgi:hypothetical protein